MPLVVTKEFAVYRRGDRIDDPAKEALILASENQACVRRLPPEAAEPAPRQD